MAETEILEPGPLARIARGLRERLELAFPPAKFVHQWMPSRVDREVWAELSRRVPMIGIGFNGFSKPETTGGLNAVSMWSVYAVTKNQAGNEAVLFGDALAPGQLALAEVAASVLHGHILKGLGTIQMTDAANSFVEDYKENGLSITAIEVKVPVDLGLHWVLGGRAIDPKTLTGETIQWVFGDTPALTDTITVPRGNT